MSLEFDTNGFLKPYWIIESNLEQVHEVFVAPYTEGHIRKLLWEKYTAFLSDVEKLVGKGHYHLLDGSFVSKKEEPEDVDLAMFVDYRMVIASEKEIAGMTREYWPYIDAAFLPFYPIGDKRYETFTMNDERQWGSNFSIKKMRRGKKNIEVKKGLLKIKS